MTTTAWLAGPAVAGAAFLILAIRYRAPMAGFWAIAAVAGQSSSLQLTHAGRWVGYQHLASTTADARQHPVAVGILVAIVAVTLFEALRRRGEIVSGFRANALAWSAAIATGSLLAAAPSASAKSWTIELLLAAALQVTAFLCACFAIRSMPTAASASLEARIDAWSSRREGEPPRLDRFALMLAGVFLLVSATLSVASYQGHPHVPDELAYLIHARYFAAGLPWMAPPPVPTGFESNLVEIEDNRWYSVFPPGWPAVLAIGVRLGVPWLVNPVLGAAAVLMTWLLLHELTERRIARVATVLLAASPWHLFTSMSLMSHTLSLVLALGCALGVVRGWRTRSWWPPVAAGLALGVLGMSRPLEGVAMAAVIGLPLVVLAFRARRPWPLIGLGTGTLITGLLGLAYNRVITGSALVFPAERYFDRTYGPGRYEIGFGPEKGLGWSGLDPYPGHGAIDVVVNSVLNGFMINVDLFGWWTGSIALVVFGALVARSSVERGMIAAVVVIVVLHAFFWFSGGPDFGARYWYLAIVPIVVLCARGLVHLDASAAKGRPQARLVAVLLGLVAFTTFVPWRAVDKYRGYRGMTPPPSAWSSDPRFTGALVLVSGEQRPSWASAAAYNPVDLTSNRMIYAWDRDADTRRALLAAYPDRPVWLVAGPTHETDHFVILRGPVLPADRASLDQP